MHFASEFMCGAAWGVEIEIYVYIKTGSIRGIALEHESRQNDARNNSIEDNVPYIFMRQLHVEALSLRGTCADQSTAQIKCR